MKLGMEPHSQCHLLGRLPPELRVEIYEYIFAERCHASLMITSGTKIELTAPAKAHAALVKTCKTIRNEAAPILYDSAIFRVQIYPMEGYPRHGGLIASNMTSPFLSNIRHLQVKVCVVSPKDVKPATHLVKTFARALDSAHANIETLEVVSNFRIRFDGPGTIEREGSNNNDTRWRMVSDNPSCLLDRFRAEWRMV